MYRIDRDEKELTSLLEHMAFKTAHWPEKEESFSDRLLDQRFGSQLRDEDFVEAAVHYKDFKIRDRSEELKKNSSGFSEVRYDENEFTIRLDVWPFKNNELAIMVKPDSYIVIKGEHKEKFEDGSDCSRSFQRYYRIPNGSNVMKCEYCKGILEFTVTRDGEVDETRKLRIVPIIPVTCREDESAPSERKRSRMETDADSDINKEQAETTLSQKGEFVPSKDSKASDQEIMEKVAHLVKSMEAKESTICIQDDVVANALKNLLEAFKSGTSEGKGKTVEDSSVSVVKSSDNSEDSDVAVESV